MKTIFKENEARGMQVQVTHAEYEMNVRKVLFFCCEFLLPTYELYRIRVNFMDHIIGGTDDCTKIFIFIIPRVTSKN